MQLRREATGSGGTMARQVILMAHRLPKMFASVEGALRLTCLYVSMISAKSRQQTILENPFAEKERSALQIYIVLPMQMLLLHAHGK